MWVTWCVSGFHHGHLEHLSVLWNTWWWQGVTHTHRAWGCWKCTLCVFKPSKCLSTYTSELYLSLQGNTMDQHYVCLHAVRMNRKQTHMENEQLHTESHTHACVDDDNTIQNTSGTNNNQKGSSVVVTRTWRRNSETLVCTSCRLIRQTRIARAHRRHDTITLFEQESESRLVAPISCWFCKSLLGGKAYLYIC